MEHLKAGLTAAKTVTVGCDDLAVQVGSGDAEVYATPKLVNLIESVSAGLVLEHLSDPELTSVGTVVNISHLAATPEGMKVTAEVEITEVDGRRIVFAVTARDEKDLICKGTHERFIVQRAKFTSKAKAKLC